MEWIWNSVNPVSVWVSAALLLLLVLYILVRVRNGKRPPGPPGWPIIGNMFELGDLPHQTMYKLGSKYGPVLWLQLGSVNTMVVQNAAAATELFKKHDVTFCDRKSPDAFTVFDFNKGSIGMNNYGGHWRTLRRICTRDFLVNRKLNETTDLRRKNLDDLVRWIEDDSAASRAQGGSGTVPLSLLLFYMAFNLVGNLIFSKDLLDVKDPQAHDLFKSMHEILELGGTPNIGDFLPFLKWMDPQGIRRRMTRNLTKTMKIFSTLVQERLENRGAGKFQERTDFLDILLDYKGDGKDDGPERLTEMHVNTVIMEMFFAGTETASITVEWGLAELLRSPHAFKKVREEIDEKVGVNRKVEESDIENLPYLQAVVKELLRLHPVLPLALPRSTTEDTNYMGYSVPKGTQVHLNAWAIGRDPEFWEDPLSFKPERFLNSNIEYKGQHFGLIPFGSGRRICVGLPLAQRVVHHTLATLVQAFDWDLTDGVNPEDINMDESLGLSLKKKNPLQVIPKKRIHV